MRESECVRNHLTEIGDSIRLRALFPIKRKGFGFQLREFISAILLKLYKIQSFKVSLIVDHLMDRKL